MDKRVLFFLQSLIKVLFQFLKMRGHPVIIWLPLYKSPFFEVFDVIPIEDLVGFTTVDTGTTCIRLLSFLVNMFSCKSHLENISSFYLIIFRVEIIC